MSNGYKPHMLLLNLRQPHFKNKQFFYYIYSWGVGTCYHTNVKVRGQTFRRQFSFYQVSPRVYQTEHIRLGDKYLFLLSHLTITEIDIIEICHIFSVLINHYVLQLKFQPNHISSILDRIIMQDKSFFNFIQLKNIWPLGIVQGKLTEESLIVFTGKRKRERTHTLIITDRDYKEL